MRWTCWALPLAVACGEPGLEPALQARYDANCATCHEAGAADAPRRGDEEDWSRRRRRGFDAMVETLLRGNVAMPPRGLCYDCSEEELRALARYVSGS